MPQAGDNWRPSASRAALQYRSGIIAAIRAFFAARGCIEVHTPVIAAAATSDPHLMSLPIECMGRSCWLQSSPEQHMKRLLAAGVGDCYQIGPVFRKDELGMQHNPEFTMLEWYRLGFDLSLLMDECRELMRHLHVDASDDITSISYSRLWNDYLPGNPHRMDKDALMQLVAPEQQRHMQGLMADQLRDYLFASVIQPQLRRPLLVYAFPLDSCAMAQAGLETASNGDEYPVAERFELYWKGVEILNGYNELRHAEELRQRYQRDARIRKQRRLASVPPLEELYAAMEHGLPACAGAALGVERLLMCLMDVDSIREVMAFPFDIA